VLDIAPLIMVTLPTVSSFFSTCGCFLRGGRSPSGDLPPLSLACGWPPGANGSLSLSNGGASRALGLKILWYKEGGPNRRREWAGPAGLGRPTQAHLGPVRSSLRSHGSSCIYALCPFHLHDLDDVILASKMEVLRA
jgi:hypothetical protein